MTRTILPLSRILERSLRRQRRLVEVSVQADRHEVDSLQTSDPETLRASLRPIYAHLPAHDAVVRFSAVEEEWLPFGIRRSRRSTALPNLRAAVSYLAGSHPVVIPADDGCRPRRTVVEVGRGER